MANDVEKFAIAPLHGFATFKIARILERAAITMIRKQDTGFLVRFADRGNPKDALGLVEDVPALTIIRPFTGFVPGLRLTSRKYQRTGCKIDLVMSLDH